MTLAEYWITMRIPDTDAVALEQAQDIEHDDRVAGVIWQEPSDGSAIVAFQIRGPVEPSVGNFAVVNDAMDAYRILRRNAGLDPDEPPGITTSMELRVLPDAGALPPRATPTPASLPYERLLLQARTAYAHSRGELGEYGQAITLASTACEMAVARAMRRLMASRDSDLLPALEGLIGNRFSLTDKRVVAMWDALAGDGISDTSFWSGYKELQARRQAVAHEGESGSRGEVEKAVAIAQELCNHVTGLAP